MTDRCRESFENVYLDLSKQPGRFRMADSGLGWKPSAGDERYTLDKDEITSAQWSRAAKGYEVRIQSRSAGVIQFDGFDQEVGLPSDWGKARLIVPGF